MGFLADKWEAAGDTWKEAGPVKKAGMVAAAAAIGKGVVVPAVGLSLLGPAYLAAQAGGGGPKGLAATARNIAGRGKAGELLGRFGRSAALYIPNQFEREYRKHGLANWQRLQGAKGGFTPGELQRALATGKGVIQAEAKERLAQLARGGSIGVGQSGVRAQMMRDAAKDKMGQVRAVVSAVRDADVAKLARDRAVALKDLLQARNLEYQRRQLAVKALQPAPSESEQMKKMKMAADIYKTKAGTEGTELLTPGVMP